jgi:predicted DNA-binding protein (MmcQ/YjbR family)
MSFDFTAARNYCLEQPGSCEDFPFGPDIYVYKSQSKIFAILTEKDALARINLKADPTEAVMLRQLFAAVTPGYHMNKTHWNTVLLDGTVPVNEVKRQIDNSWALIQPKRRRKVTQNPAAD